MRIVKARKEHIREIAEIRMAHLERLRMYTNVPPSRRLIEDYFLFYWENQPEDFLVCLDDGRVVGYIVISTNQEKLIRRVLLKGYLWRWLFSWMMGRYNLDIRSVLKAAERFMATPGTRKSYTLKDKAYVVSVATHPGCLERGVAARLLEEAFSCVRSRKVKQIVLNVGRENQAAIELFSKVGFQIIGEDRFFYTMLKVLD